MKSFISTFWRNENGATLVEVTVVLTLTLILTFGAVEALLLFHQYNNAVKAAERGARLAVVSDAAVLNFSTLTALPSSPTTVRAGDRLPSTGYERGDQACTGGTSANCDRTAFERIFYGRPKGTNRCGDASSPYDAGICDIAGNVQPANVTIRYRFAQLDYYGVPPSPIVSVEISGVRYELAFLRLLDGVISRLMPNIVVTATGEDLKSAAPPP